MLEALKGAFTRAKTAVVVAGGTAVATLAPSAMAQTAYDGLTAAVDWADVGTALLAVGVAVIGVVVIIKGIKFVVRMVKGA